MILSRVALVATAALGGFALLLLAVTLRAIVTVQQAQSDEIVFSDQISGQSRPRSS